MPGARKGKNKTTPQEKAKRNRSGKHQGEPDDIDVVGTQTTPTDPNENDNVSTHSHKSDRSGGKSDQTRKTTLAAEAAAIKAEIQLQEFEMAQQEELEQLEMEVKRRKHAMRLQRLKMELRLKETEVSVSDPVRETQVTPLRATAPEFVPTQLSSVNNAHDDANHHQASADIATVIDAITNSAKLDRQIMADAINASRLPPPEPGIFTGDPLTYPDWVCSFDELIESRRVSPTERLHYLKRYVGGKAKETVESYFLLRSKEAYDKAKERLETRFGNKYVIAEAFRKKLEEWPSIKPRDGEGLRAFGDFLQQCATAKINNEELAVLDSSSESKKMLKILPDWLITKWMNVVALSKEVEGRYPNFTAFVEFISKEADKSCDPVASIQAVKGIKGQSQDKTPTVFTPRKATAKTFVTQREAMFCVLCNKNTHALTECRVLQQKSKAEREDFIRKGGLCFRCLTKGHRSKDCRKKIICKTCEKRHPTACHDDALFHARSTAGKTAGNHQNQPEGQNLKTNTCNAESTSMMSMVLPVYVAVNGGPEHLVYALLDTQSDTSFITESLGDLLTGASYEKVQLKLSTMTSTTRIQCKRYKEVQVRGIRSNKIVTVKNLYSKDDIPANRSHIPTPERANVWPHLRGISHAISPLQDCEIGLLIGYNCAEALAPTNVVLGDEGQPFAVETILGWTVVGGSTTLDADGLTHRIVTLDVPNDIKHDANQKAVQLIYCKERVKEISPLEVAALMVEPDIAVCQNEDRKLSQEDMKFLEIMEDGIHQREDKFYEMPLPFRVKRPNLPNNAVVAEKRLAALKRRMQNDLDYCQQYELFMHGIIANGEAEESSKENAKWYIPHHGVFHPRKKKLRVVMDCSAVYKGTSLNEHLLQGPDLLNSLVGILCRFRMGPIAVQCDIEKMFHRFRVNEEDRDYLSFLWWKEGDMLKDPAVYRMCVHVFGAVSSPCCANFGLRTLANDQQCNFCESTCEFLRTDFYVDDGLRSFLTEEEAIRTVEESRELCKAGNIRLHKFLSNNANVMRAVPESERAEITDSKSLPGPVTERALGVQWNVSQDEFQFHVVPPDKPMTRRGMLSTIASLYDPLGCLAPFVLKGRLILQELCMEHADWDVPLSDEIQHKWSEWLHNLAKLDNLSVSRCFIPNDWPTHGETSYEMHHFSDASRLGYGQCSYLRLKNGDRVHCALVMGKGRVAPKKAITVPRLELTAAVLTMKVGAFLSDQLPFKGLQHFYYSDSKIVLGYIKNEAKRFHVFVANRVQQIRNLTEPHQWRYVDTKDNPADHASRGLNVEELQRSNWFKGPTFLWENQLDSNNVDEGMIPENDPEVKTTHLMQEVQQAPVILERLSRYSDWSRAVAALAVIIRAIRKKTGTAVESMLQLKEEVKKRVVSTLQDHELSDTVKLVRDGEFGKRGVTGLQKLDPFIDEDDILRVGGRLTRALMPFTEKHPAILPRRSHVTQLVIKHYHEKVYHQGRGMTMNAIRANGYWIIGCSKAVESYIYKCVTCKRLRGATQSQKMADLPEDRTEVSAPFTHCGMDCFGPFIIKENRKELKRYGLVVTCMASRAVHIELLDDMSTDALINGLRCTIAIRGHISSIRCDQGSNFVGCSNELRNSLSHMPETRLKTFLEANQCVFIWNPPHASHMGGVWERQIRTIRSVLTGMLLEHGSRLQVSTLRTFLYEVMAIVNSRPLSAQNLSDPQLEPLTANHLIMMKSKVYIPPPGNFVRQDIYARKRWKQVQALANEFWCRWKREYLQNNQVRPIWQKEQQNLKVGDIVMMGDDDLRGQWKLARVTKAVQDQDGLVRKVEVRHDKGSFERPIHKLKLLLSPD